MPCNYLQLETSCAMQCEDKCTVRPCLPTPGKGALPLPASLPPAMQQQLAFKPSRIEDLNVVLPPGCPQLATTKPDPRVSC